jgi:hypothetical protein
MGSGRFIRPPVASHDDVIDVVLLGVVNDRPPRFSDFEHGRYLDAVLIRQRMRFVENIGRPFTGLVVPLLREFLGRWLVPGIPRFVRHYDVQNRDFLVGIRGQGVF